MTEEIQREHEFKVPPPSRYHCAWVLGKDAQGRPIYCGIPRDRHWRKPLPTEPKEPRDGP